MTWDNLRLCTTLQYAIYETLRKYPALPNISRNAIQDTVLPRGGGPDGSCPIVVPKGAPVTCCLYLMHWREQEWGSDPEAFRPERCKLYAVCIFVELI
jgi:cytochrome P450